MAWTKTTEGKDVLFEETVVVNDSGGSAATYAFTSAIPNDIANWENKKITVRLEVTEVSATDGDIDAYIQTSVNGLTTGDTVAPAAVAFPNWANASANLDFTLDTSALSVSSLVADLTDVYAPYMRVYLYTDGADIEDACSVKVSIAIAAEDVLEASDIGGIGADPS
mgnify:FL=1|tara:strand:- start:15516 stop:16016 length:501 start_codon:yes stop_codon:yes gene_type:complete